MDSGKEHGDPCCSTVPGVGNHAAQITATCSRQPWTFLNSGSFSGPLISTFFRRKGQEEAAFS